MSEMLAPTVKAEAIAAVLTQSFTVRDLESDEYGRRIVHCRGRVCGADWDEHAVIETIRKAKQVEWVNGFGHDLSVTEPSGQTWWFQVERPAEVVL